MFFLPSLRFSLTLRAFWLLSLRSLLWSLLRPNVLLRWSWLLNLRASLLRTLLNRRLRLMLLDLGPLLILVLPLLLEDLPLLLRTRLVALDAPRPLLRPMLSRMPALPVLLKLSVRNRSIVPPVPLPRMVSVVGSPVWVYIKIKSWNVGIITPAPVIIVGAIPPTLPETPPPAIPEKHVYGDIRHNVHIVRIRERDHIRGGRKGDGWRQRNIHGNPHLCHRGQRNDNGQRQKQCSKQSLFHVVASFSTFLKMVIV
jgi:hypothetical protein